MATAPTVPRIPRIAVTAGEPAGIGPELVAALARRDWPLQLVAIGDAATIAARALDSRLELVPYDPALPAAPARAGRLEVLDVPLAAPAVAGRLDPANAGHVLQVLARASDGALDGRFDAVVTAPVHKGVINDGGQAFTGHTEFFAGRARCAVVMMLAAPRLRVALATTHLPLAAVPAAITREGLACSLRILDHDLRARFGIARPRIGVLGLNPHAGEGGHLGREEIETIAPVLAALRDEGLELEGPLAADTAFVPARLDRCNAYLAMYHDQGLPVLKALGFGDAVNVTLGLPYVRTSVDHGVALDLAGSGRADPASLHAALELARVLALRGTALAAG